MFSNILDKKNYQNFKISTYDVILAQNVVLLTQIDPVSHKTTHFDVFYPFNDFHG